MRPIFVRATRAFLPAVMTLAVAGTLGIAGPSWRAQAAEDSRTLSFYNRNTKETMTITYKRDGAYLPAGLKQINFIMRDWRRNKPAKMDPKLIDTIWELYRELGSKEPIQLISGYRSKRTNERLRRRGGGQARRSQHILGKAADIRFPDVPVKKMRNSALVREVGGVGYYPKSGLPFVHVDTGRVRNWPRLPRQELAALFPTGKTKYLPRDGRPITKRDSKIALARLDRTIDAFISRKSRIKLPSKVIMAGLAPPALSWPAADPLTTASIPRETPSASEAEGKSLTSQAPPRIAISALEDAEHPEELSFQLLSMLPLMGDASISADRRLARLTAPDMKDNNYLLREPEGGYSTSLAMGLGYTQELKLVTFGARGPKTVRAPRAARTTIRTASR